MVGGFICGRGLVGAFDAVQFGDARSFAFPNAVGNAVFLVLTAAEFAFDLDMRAALQGTSEFGELRPANDAVPIGAGGKSSRWSSGRVVLTITEQISPHVSQLDLKIKELNIRKGNIQ